MERITFNQKVLETIIELKEFYKMYGNGRQHPTSPLEHAILMCHTELGNFFRQKELIERVQIDNNGGEVYEEYAELNRENILKQIDKIYHKCKADPSFADKKHEWEMGTEVASLIEPQMTLLNDNGNTIQLIRGIPIKINYEPENKYRIQLRVV